MPEPAPTASPLAGWLSTAAIVGGVVVEVAQVVVEASTELHGVLPRGAGTVVAIAGLVLRIAARLRARAGAPPAAKP